MRWKRWERLLDGERQTAEDVLCDLLAEELAGLLDALPPAAADMEWGDARVRARFEPALGSMPRLERPLALLVARLLELDLLREHEAIDHLFRTDAHRAACPTSAHETLLHFSWQLATDQLLWRNEQLHRPLARSKLAEVARRLAARLRKGAPAAEELA